ncbi:MAG: hypothetical protein RQ761_08545 [Bacteroidales bacterium]|nr:hypothetical protein [Bacteroidales bacterium]
MKNMAILEKMAKHAAQLSTHIERLRNKPERLHELDIDVLTDKMKLMYTLMMDLLPDEEQLDPSGNEPGSFVDSDIDIPNRATEEGLPVTSNPEEAPVGDVENDNTPVSPEDEVKQTEPDPIVPDDPTPHSKSVPDMMNEPSAEQQPQSEPEIQTPETKELPVSEEDNASPVEDDKDKIHRPKTTADLFSGTTTIADSFKKEEDSSIAARVVPQGVQNLKTAIGINDKFLFINALFKGNPNDYNSAIDHLNTLEDGNKAITSLNNYRQEYGWSDDSEAWHRLRKIVLSKYSD